MVCQLEDTIIAYCGMADSGQHCRGRGVAVLPSERATAAWGQQALCLAQCLKGF